MTIPLQFTQALRSWMDIFMHRSMRGWSHFAKASGLSMPQFSIIMQLHHRGACGISDISDGFEITNAAASQLVEKLVQSGYLERTEDPSDRRARLLNLSTKGRRLIERGRVERYRWMDQIEAVLSPEERERVAQALVTLSEAARKLEEPAIEHNPSISRS
jgi:DNA-binding MarR family transcriptional regulator